MSDTSKIMGALYDPPTDRFVTTKSIVFELKQIVAEGSLEDCIDYVDNIVQYGYSHISWGYIWQKCYMYACSKHRKDIALWLEKILDLLPEIERIAVRQTIKWGHFVLAKQN